MDCDLDLGEAEGEPIVGYEQRFGVSDKQVACDECERPILAGVEHEIVTGECDGESFEAHTCMDCYHIATGLDGDRMHGHLWSILEIGGEHGAGAFDRFTTGCLLKVDTASAKAYLVERFNKWKALNGSR